MRQSLGAWLEELVVAQAVPGLLFCAGWSAMYEIYHEDGSYYTTLIQEVVGSEGFFPYFLVAILLMALPVGMVLDAVREILVGWRLAGLRTSVAQRWPAPSLFDWIQEGTPRLDHIEERVFLYRHAWSTLLVPARAAGNIALVLLIFLVWFLVKVVHMSAWHVFSWAFIVGTPLVGLLIVRALLHRCVGGTREFRRLTTERIFPAPASSPAASQAESTPAGSSADAAGESAPTPLDTGPRST